MIRQKKSVMYRNWSCLCVVCIFFYILYIQVCFFNKLTHCFTFISVNNYHTLLIDVFSVHSRVHLYNCPWVISAFYNPEEWHVHVGPMVAALQAKASTNHSEWWSCVAAGVCVYICHVSKSLRPVLQGPHVVVYVRVASESKEGETEPASQSRSRLPARSACWMSPAYHILLTWLIWPHIHYTSYTLPQQLVRVFVPSAAHQLFQP